MAKDWLNERRAWGLWFDAICNRLDNPQFPIYTTWETLPEIYKSKWRDLANLATYSDDIPL